MIVTSGFSPRTFFKLLSVTACVFALAALPCFVKVGMAEMGLYKAKSRTVIIDPGHGGREIGAKGPGDFAEKDVTLALARMVASSLSPRYHAVLTRTGDYNIDIADRAAMANRVGATLYISIHAGGGFSPAANGIIIFYPGPATRARSASASFSTGNIADTGPLTWDRVYERHLRQSRYMATLAKKALEPLAGPDGFAVVKQACLAQLEGVDMPAILVELDSVANPAVEARLEDPGYLSAVATAISSAINHFLQQITEPELRY